MAPSSVEQALRENIQLKVEFQTLRTELKRYKKLLLEGDKALRRVTEERDEYAKMKGKGRSSLSSNREREYEKELRSRTEERDEWEKKARELQRALKEAAGSEELEVNFLLLTISSRCSPSCSPLRVVRTESTS